MWIFIRKRPKFGGNRKYWGDDQGLGAVSQRGPGAEPQVTSSGTGFTVNPLPELSFWGESFTPEAESYLLRKYSWILYVVEGIMQNTWNNELQFMK